MYAIIRTGGKQYRVEPGFELLVEKLDVETANITRFLLSLGLEFQTSSGIATILVRLL